MMLLLFLGMFAWGTWANTLKAAGDKWRFELYCFDFAIGAVIAATLIALTWGNLGFDGFSFLDDLRLAGKRQELFAFGGGAIFNLGNMLLLAGVSLVGMGVAFPVSMGFGLVIGVCWNYALNPGGNAALLFTGAAVVLGAVVVATLGYRTYTAELMRVLVEAGRIKSKSCHHQFQRDRTRGSWRPFARLLRPSHATGARRRKRPGTLFERLHDGRRYSFFDLRIQPFLHESSRKGRAGRRGRLLPRPGQKPRNGPAGRDHLVSRGDRHPAREPR